MICVKQAVTELVHKAKESTKADDALKFSQAACNVANARGTMIQVQLAVEREAGPLPDKENTG